MGLLVVVLGFYLYQEPVLGLEKRRAVEEGRKEEEEGEEEEEAEEEEEEERRTMGARVPSFQERVVAGLGPAIYQQSHGGHGQHSRHHHHHHHHVTTTTASESTA